MGHTHLLVFAAAYLAVLVLPGPGVTALVSRVLTHRPRGSSACVAGFVAGSLVWFTIASTGPSALASSFAGLFVAIRWAGAACLLFLAWTLWTAPRRPLAPSPASGDRGRLLLTGLSINLGNPKVIVFFLALLPTVVDLDRLTLVGFAGLALIVAIASTVLGAHALAAARARRVPVACSPRRAPSAWSIVAAALSWRAPLSPS